MSDGKRRLPIVDAPSAPSPGRPSWQWIGIGVGVTFLLWMPLAYVAQLAARGYWARRLGETEPTKWAEAYDRLEGGARIELQAMLGAVLALAFLVAATIGGLVLGRFDEASGLRDATIAGALVAVLAAVLAVVTTVGVGSGWGWLVATVVTGGLGAGAGRLGAWLGRPGRRDVSGGER